MEPSWISIVPPLLAVVLAFVTREAVISLVVACIVGVLLLGHGPQGFPDLLLRSLGTEAARTDGNDRGVDAADRRR